MRVFLLACIGVLALAFGAYALLEGAMGRNAGTEFAAKNSTRVSDANKPDPRGFLSNVHQPAGGVTAGRSQVPGAPSPQTNRAGEETRGRPAQGTVTDAPGPSR